MPDAVLPSEDDPLKFCRETGLRSTTAPKRAELAVLLGGALPGRCRSLSGGTSRQASATFESTRQRRKGWKHAKCRPTDGVLFHFAATATYANQSAGRTEGDPSTESSQEIMRIDPATSSIGKDQVTYFSMVSDPRDHRLHEIVGEIAVEFGRLEYLVKAAIEKLTRQFAVQRGHPEEDTGFIEGMLQAENNHTFSACCIHLRELYAKWQTDPERLSAFRGLIEGLLRSGDERNAIIHGCWST